MFNVHKRSESITSIRPHNMNTRAGFYSRSLEMVVATRFLRDVERVPTLSLIAGKTGLGVAVIVTGVTGNINMVMPQHHALRAPAT